MSGSLRCYRCGASLDALSLPLSRQDECPECSNYLHVCRMCVHYDRNVPKQCREDDAEEVIEKERPNFCDWFEPDTAAYDGREAAAEARARSKLAALFGDGDGAAAESDETRNRAEDLFK
ncbi:MAG: hypothetical protein ACREQZ_00940 [Woeseiaceae bacterium]